jgi:hypothetical protein
MVFTWDKEEMLVATNENNLFFHRNERPQEEKNNIKREILPKLWPKVSSSNTSLVKGE